MPAIVRILGVALILSLGFLQPVAADRLLIETLRDDEGELEDQLQRGLTKEQVESRLGAPDARRDAVGDPPITRWDYDGFSVYFEYDRVLRAVQQR
ncbi:hypothetical protein [Aquisalimonas asiatica]|uniref:SmpA / OmlA family protein n=1 Tax=Aquisalimonas asiatica TaxID=406100 RepID=A0A1H8QG72_9GAMM|nr:hypothetical protein [Aquisalimonas asiatica]SEO52907.1 hypothetical protein SAMN04488052_101551 [Aquisalimonas asiatica]